MSDLASLIGEVADASTVMIGGSGLQRKPMALVRALADSGASGLKVISYLGSVDVEFLVSRNVVSEIHSAGVSLDGFGLAPAFRGARQGSRVSFVEWSEASLAASLEAAALGLPSTPAPTSPDSDLLQVNPYLTSAPDPFTTERMVFAKALQPDLALLHLSAVDASGNGYIAGDLGADGLAARAATRTVATADEETDDDPHRAAIPRLWLDEVVVIGSGSWPTGSHPRHLVDVAVMTKWAQSDGSDSAILEAV